MALPQRRIVNAEILRQRTPALNLLLGRSMDFVIDLDVTHRVFRVTITAAVLTEELAEDYYRNLSLVAARGGPYAAICDYSRVTSTTLSSDTVRGWAKRHPAPGRRDHVLVAKESAIFGLARMLQLHQDFWGEHFQVVRSLEEAYAMLGVRPEDFTRRVFPQDLAA
jgi:hypothetical protein